MAPNLTPKTKMIIGAVLLLGGSVIYAITKQAILFLVPLGGYVMFRWGQNEQSRLEKEKDREEEEDARHRSSSDAGKKKSR